MLRPLDWEFVLVKELLQSCGDIWEEQLKMKRWCSRPQTKQRMELEEQELGRAGSDGTSHVATHLVPVHMGPIGMGMGTFVSVVLRLCNHCVRLPAGLAGRRDFSFKYDFRRRSGTGT